MQGDGEESEISLENKAVPGFPEPGRSKTDPLWVAGIVEEGKPEQSSPNGGDVGQDAKMEILVKYRSEGVGLRSCRGYDLGPCSLQLAFRPDGLTRTG